MDLNKLRIFQMIQSALAKKGITSSVLSLHVPIGCNALVVDGGLAVIQDTDATETELLEWHAEIERV